MCMEEVMKSLRNGKIVIHNTDTCLGMAVDILNEEAVSLLYKVKRMERVKPVSILCSDLKMAREYGVFSKKALTLAEKYLPGALTLVVPRTEKLPPWINPGLNNIGIRVPDDSFSLEMVRGLGNPVTTTSCNISGESVCRTFDDVLRIFAKYVETKDALIAFKGTGTEKVSTIVKVEEDEMTIIRKGEVEFNRP